MAESSDDQEEGLNYMKKDLLIPLTGPRPWQNHPGYGGGGEDDDSNNMFMSEPSISEADDSSEHHVRLLSSLGSDTTDDGDDLDDYGLYPPPPPPARLPTTNHASNHPYHPHPLPAPSSPGNTSLSSWESPHWNQNRRIHLHFSPDPRGMAEDASSASATGNLNHARLGTPSGPQGPLGSNHDFLASALIPPSSNGGGGGGGGAKTPDRSYGYSSNSTSPASEGQRLRLEAFLNDLRLKSRWQVQESNDALNLHNTSLDSLPFFGNQNATTQIDFNGILRSSATQSPPQAPQPDFARLSRVNTEIAQDPSTGTSHSDPHVSFQPPHTTDETVVMSLSDDSGDEATKSNANERESAFTQQLDWEEKGSADNEQTTRERRGHGNLRIRACKSSQGTPGGRGHRRQRSGDAAAATLSTGSKEWKGMEHDRIPLPPIPGDHDDDEDDETDTTDAKSKESSTHSLGMPRPEAAKTPGVFSTSTPRNTSGSSATPSRSARKQAEIEDFSKFALGTGGSKAAVRRSSYARNRRSFRGRKQHGLKIDSEDSSSMASADPSPQNVYPTRHASLPAASFSSGYMPSPDWSQSQQRRHFRQGTHPINWSPRSHQSAASSAPGTEHRYHAHHPASWNPAWHIDQGEPPQTLPQGRAPSQSVDFGHINHAHHAAGRPQVPAPKASWAQASTGSIETTFSWLSNRNGPTTEMSPLLGEGVSSIHNPDVHSMLREENPTMYPFDETSPSVERKPRVGFLPHDSPFHRSPFSRIGKRFSKADRQRFLPGGLDDEDERKYQCFVCPVCLTRQREFFTVTNAPRQFESASSYIALYFGVYVIAALYIFGLQEGWTKLDCIYFAVITLTTAGLGDFVPTSDGAKVVCSIFIYFGVACIGLLLGSYIAGMLDESSRRAARANRIKSCPNCVRIRNTKDATERRRRNFRKEQKKNGKFCQSTHGVSESDPMEHDTKRVKRQHIGEPLIDDQLILMTQSARRTQPVERRRSEDSGFIKIQEEENALYGTNEPSDFSPAFMLGSPSTKHFLRRSGHSRHFSLDLNGGHLPPGAGSLASSQRRKYSVDLEVPVTIDESTVNQTRPTVNPPLPPEWQQGEYKDEHDEESSSTCSETSADSSNVSLHLEDQFNGVKNARYVFLTLREALINSLVIIGFGCFGFYFIEGFSFIDSWYFTTVLLTTVGYGDLVPYTKGGKLFATVYILVAGTILLNNMSMISMIPLELRRRRTEQAVLTQFGDALDDTALRELATGPLIRRLNLTTEHVGGLDECTREMFCLAMLVRLGKVTEEDIKLTFAAFKKLDVNDEKVLNSRAIIAGMIQKRRSTINLNKLVPEDSQTVLNLSSRSYGSRIMSPFYQSWYGTSSNADGYGPQPAPTPTSTNQTATPTSISGLPTPGGMYGSATPSTISGLPTPRSEYHDTPTFWSPLVQSQAIQRGGFSH